MLIAIEEQFNNYEEVELYSRHLIELDSSIVDAYIYLGNALSRSEKYEEAVAQYQIALERHPESATVWSRLAFLQFNLGKLEESERSVRNSIQLMPEDIQNNILLEKILLRKGKTDEAIELLQQIILQKPDDEDLWVDLITAISEGKQYHLLIDFCDQVSGKFPNEAAPWFAHGYALQESGQHNDALECYKKAIELAPGLGKVWVNMGVLYRESGNYKDAIYCFRKALHYGLDNAAIHSDLGDMLRNIGSIDESEKHCRIAVEHAPDFAPVLVCLGRVLTEKAKYPGSDLVSFKRHWNSCRMQLNQSQLYHLYMSGWGNIEKSRDLLQPLLDRENLPHDILNTYAELAVRLGNQSEIINIIEKALTEG